ncbi:MAG TPA: oxygenase MpaB family protein [Rhizomicrobium sp.]|nr:oxygenase MpaB family protein [Rhizomicrobium sp.]
MDLDTLLDQAQALPAPAIPARHGQEIKRARRISARLGKVLLRNSDPTEAEWTMLGRALLRGDAEMDDLVSWMASGGLGEGRALFDQALEHGIDSLADAPAPLRAFFARYDVPPPWLDMAEVEHGAQIARMQGNMGSYILRDGALMGGYQAPGFNKVLVMTGALSKGPSKRLAETSQWWLNCTDTGGMTRFGAGFKSTLRVRLIHALVRRHVATTADWDVAQDGIPLNQLDMAATQLAFGPVYLVGARTLGIVLTKRDGAALMHLMRYAGYLMGIEEALLPTSEKQGQRMIYHMLLSVVGRPDAEGHTLALSLANEPLDRPYPNFARVRAWATREAHLSVNVFFLGLPGMENLGLPRRYIPWFPLAAMPFNFVRSIASRFARERFARSGRRAQQAWVRSLTGTRQKIGGAAAKIVEAV